MVAGSVELRAQVGAGGSYNSNGQPSKVRLQGTAGIFAPGGHRGWDGDEDGSTGYSGGGGSSGGYASTYGGNGGSNGNDGGHGSGSYSYPGGSGTWEDITAYQLTEFTLSPGQGGQSYQGSFGGGGGGVLVGGTGPSRSQYQGEGYGGGGAYDGSTWSGLPGVILVEVV